MRRYMSLGVVLASASSLLLIGAGTASAQECTNVANAPTSPAFNQLEGTGERFGACTGNADIELKLWRDGGPDEFFDEFITSSTDNFALGTIVARATCDAGNGDSYYTELLIGGEAVSESAHVVLPNCSPPG